MTTLKEEEERCVSLHFKQMLSEGDASSTIIIIHCAKVVGRLVSVQVEGSTDRLRISLQWRWGGEFISLQTLDTEFGTLKIFCCLPPSLPSQSAAVSPTVAGSEGCTVVSLKGGLTTIAQLAALRSTHTEFLLLLPSFQCE